MLMQNRIGFYWDESFLWGLMAIKSLRGLGIEAEPLTSADIREGRLESFDTLFVPGGLYGSVRDTLGRIPAKIAAAALLVERLLLGPLAAIVAGHYAVAFGRTLVGATPGGVGETAPMSIAIVLLGAVWWMQRQGRPVPDLVDPLGDGHGALLLAVGSLAMPGRGCPPGGRSSRPPSHRTRHRWPASPITIACAGSAAIRMPDSARARTSSRTATLTASTPRSEPGVDGRTAPCPGGLRARRSRPGGPPAGRTPTC